MNKKIAALGASPALGFWNRHCDAVDGLYELYDPDGAEVEDEDVPQALAAVWKDEVRREQLIKVFEHGERDRDRLLAAAYAVMEGAFGGNASPLRLTPRKCHDPWMVGAYAEPRRKKLPQGRIWVTISFDSVSIGEYLLVVTLWAKGGRNMSDIFRNALTDVLEVERAVRENWSSGSAFLARIGMKDHARPDGALDLNAVIDTLGRDLAKQTPAQFEALIEHMRQQG